MRFLFVFEKVNSIFKTTFTIKKKFSEIEITLPIGNHYQLLEFVKMENASKAQLTLRKMWSS